MNKIELNVIGISSTPLKSGAHALILGVPEGDRFIPIVISAWEAYPIATQMEKVVPPRPMTIDLFTMMAHGFGIKLEEVLIYKFEDGVFYSQLTFSDGEKTIIIDGRTSDAVAILLRTGGKLYVTQDVLAEASVKVDTKKEKPEIQEKPHRELQLEDYALEELEQDLQKAIDQEEYDTAARIKKVIDQKKASQKPE